MLLPREKRSLKTSKCFKFTICHRSLSQHHSRMKAQSTQSLSQSLYGSLPRSLKQDLLVKARMEDPDVLAERRAVVASKSVSELSQITSISDFPIPSTLSKAFHKSIERLNGMSKTKPVTDDDSR